MTRKLICIFFILVGIAAFIGTILLSLGRSEYDDISPVLTLLILSIATVVEAARRIQDSPNESEVEVSGRDMVYIRAYRAGGFLAILACLAFIVAMLFVTRYYVLMQNVIFLMALAAAGIAAAVQSLKVRPPIVRWDIVKFVAALVIAASLGFVYLNYMPKYSQEDGISMLRSDEGLEQRDVFYPDVYIMWEATGVFPRYNDYTKSLFGGNPFYEGLYEYYYNSYGYDSGGLYFEMGCIYFNPVTGAYEYVATVKKDKTYIPGDWPEFKWNYLYDEDGQHNTVLNLYFREWPFPESYAAKRNPMFSVSSSEWDAKIKDVMYPHNFSEDEAGIFLRSIGEEMLKTKLLEQINEIVPAVVLEKQGDSLGLAVVGVKDETIEIFFFGIDVATYQNGEIVLKP